MKEEHIENPELRKVADMIEPIRVAMLTTRQADGTLRSRPMETQKMDAQGDLWFFTEYDSAKSDEIHREPHVNVCYVNEDNNTYVSIGGKASLLRDPVKARELWNKLVEAWFPNGPEDPNVGLIRVSVEEAEYWKGPSSRAVSLFKMLKASVTGERPDMGENEKIEVKA